MSINRVVVWFSAGVTSAVSAKIAVDTYRDTLPVHLMNCDTGSEDDDNLRFMVDVSKWLGLPLEIIRNPKYRDTFDVYEKTGFLVGPMGARCTLELKKLPRRQYEDLTGDLQVFGFDANEADRAREFEIHNPEVRTWFPLLERGITKTDARQILLMAGIAEPVTYSQGFHNANCLKRGCVKGGMGYWNHIRKVKPEVFANMAAMERKLKRTICKTETLIDGKRTRVDVYLDELDQNAGNYDAEPGIQCGLFCGLEGAK